MNPIVAKKINVNGEIEDVMVGAGEVDLQIIRSHVGGPVDLGLTGYRDGVRLEFAVGEFSLVDTTSIMNPVASGLLGRVCCGTMMVWAVDESGAALSYPGDVLVEGASGPAGGPSGYTDPLAVEKLGRSIDAIEKSSRRNAQIVDELTDPCSRCEGEGKRVSTTRQGVAVRSCRQCDGLGRIPKGHRLTSNRAETRGEHA